MTVSITRQDYTASDLRSEAARSKDAAYARRTLGLALVLEGVPRKTAAVSCGMDRQTLRDWVHRYNAEGLAGLCNRPHAGGPVCKLNETQTAELAGWVRSGPNLEEDQVVRWRLKDLQHRIAERFQVTLHERSVGKVLARLNFSHVSARPHNPKSDEAAREAHKKTSANSLRKPFLMPPASDRSNFGGRMKRGLASKAV